MTTTIPDWLLWGVAVILGVSIFFWNRLAYEEWRLARARKELAEARAAFTLCTAHKMEPQIEPPWTLRCSKCKESQTINPVNRAFLSIHDDCPHCQAGNLLHIALCTPRQFPFQENP